MNPQKTQRIMTALSRLRLTTRSSASATDAELALQLTAYAEGLSRYSLDAIERACREWPDQQGGEWWPSLAELGRLAARHDAPESLPRPAFDDAPRGRDTRTLRDSASLRAEYVELMAELRARPERFVAAQALIAIGEDLMRKAGLIDASARAA